MENARSHGRRGRTARRRVLASLAMCAVAGVVAGALVLPHLIGNASTTAVSTISTTGTNTVDRSVAASPDAPGGARTGTAKPGDQLDWVVPYQNNTGAPASVNVKDVLTNAGTYVPGSLRLPQNSNDAGAITAQYSADAGATWTATPGPTVNGVGYTGTLTSAGTSVLSRPALTIPNGVLATSGGDGYNGVVYNGQVYSVYHHAGGAAVVCSTPSGAICTGWPSGSNVQTWSPGPGNPPIGQGTPMNGSTAFQNGTWISGSKLFWLIGDQVARTVGTACLNLAATPPTSCGYQAIATSVPDFTGDSAPISSTALRASDGLIYAAVATTSANQVVCINPATGAGCLAPKTLGTNSLTTSFRSLPASATFGDYVFASVRSAPGAPYRTYCYKVGGGGSLCSGSWPVTSADGTSWDGPNLAPVLTTSGAMRGVCTIPNGYGALPTATCWDLTGAALPAAQNPFAGTGARFTAINTSAGDTYTLGTRVYLSGGDVVLCFDFSKWSGSGSVPECEGFVPAANPINYTVRDASNIAKDCLVADGDGHRITFFNAITGTGCTGTGNITASVAPLDSYCGSGAAGITGWDRLSLPGLVAGSYDTALVTLRDQDRTRIPGFIGVQLPASGVLDLSTLPMSVTSISVSISISNVTDAAGVSSAQLSVSWRGTPPEMCFSTIAPDVACDVAAPATVSNSATAVTSSSAGSDAPGGNRTGTASFAVRAAASQCGLSISKTPTVTSVAPGGRIGYTITVTNTGTQAYDTASFTDDLTDVLKEATYNGDHAATSGAVSYAAPTLAWSGGLAPRAVATITYSVTVRDPLPAGDHSLVNTVVSSSPGSNCPSGSADPTCTATVTVQVGAVVWHKVDATAARNILGGSSWTLTPVDAQGRPAGAAIVVDDCAAAPCSGRDLDPTAGVFRVGDLSARTYQLVETRAPVGFRLDSTPIPVNITSVPTTLSLADVVNHQLPVPAIPFTGGTSTDALTFTGGGLLVIVLGLGVWHLLRRRRRTA